MITDEEKLYMDNINLAYKLAWEYYQNFKGYLELSELKSVSLLGLMKAVKSFNPEYNSAFSTYSYTVIRNEILMYVRSSQRWNNTISLETPIHESDENCLTLADTISDNFDIEEIVHNKIHLTKLYDELNGLNPRYKKIICYRLQGLTMATIGKKLKLSQPQISRDYQKILTIIRKKFKITEEL